MYTYTDRVDFVSSRQIQPTCTSMIDPVFRYCGQSHETLITELLLMFSDEINIFQP